MIFALLLLILVLRDKLDTNQDAMIGFAFFTAFELGLELLMLSRGLHL